MFLKKSRFIFLLLIFECKSKGLSSCDRIQKLGKNYSEIARIIGTYPTLISKWIKTYKNGGFKTLIEKKNVV